MSLDIPGKVTVGIPFTLLSANTDLDGSFVLVYEAVNCEDESNPLRLELRLQRGPKGFEENMVERALVQTAAKHLVPKAAELVRRQAEASGA